MINNNSDIFEVNKKKPANSNNFFLSEETAPQQNKNVIINAEPARRLNDYDFNLLKEDAYKDVSNDVLKLEYKINKTEEEIKALDLKINAANDIGDIQLASDLTNRQNLLKDDYEALLAMYNDKSISAKISDKISNLLGGKFKNEINAFQNSLDNISKVILTRMPKSFTNVIELKKSLSKLENINRSVDELISLNIPYGEQYDKYSQLSKYIIKANSIQAELSRYIKK